MNLVATPRGRRLVFAALYLSEGAPVGFIWWALPTELRAAGVPIARITALTAVLVFPWALKFLWAPAVDVLRGRRWGLRHWIVAAQAAMGLTLLPLAALDFEAHLALVAPLLLAHAFAAATQDAAIDAWAIALTEESERGSVAGWMQAGMLTGRWLFGSGWLLAAAALGREIGIVALVGTVWLSAVLVTLSREAPLPAPGDARSRWRGFGRLLRELAGRRTTWLGLVLAGIGGAGFEAVGAVAGPFLVDRGLSTAAVGWFFTGSVVAMLAGALLGGQAADRVGHRRGTGWFLLALAAAIAALAGADAAAGAAGSPERTATVALLVAVYLGIGLFTAASYALFMDLTDPRLGATQFSAFMGATNGCESWAGFTVGRLVTRFGYPPAFLVMAALSLLALPVLPFLSRRKREAEVGAEIAPGRPA